MKAKGFRRTASQCKCKWKNLGKELSEADTGKPCPFFDELDAIYKERAKNMDRMLLESEGGARKRKKNGNSSAPRMDGQGSSDDFDDDEDDDDDENDEDERDRSGRKKRKPSAIRQHVNSDKVRARSVQDVLEDFFQRQQLQEQDWRLAMEQREAERRSREAEWRESLIRLEAERTTREEEWREREEQRRARDELRAEKRDRLFEALLARLT
eukprot:SM000190S04888  [mRNA]  locus=s190:275222:276765:- [translate_table: standard]